MSRWVKIVSWHIATGVYRSGRIGTRCGRAAKENAPQSPTLPLDEKSCETCTRFALHDEERA